MSTSSGPLQHAVPWGFQFRDQDSSLTLSTGQSYTEVATVGESKNSGKNMISKESGCSVMHGKTEESQAKSTLSTLDYVLPPSYVDHRQSFGGFSFTYPDTYPSGVIAAYGPHPPAHPEMMCVIPTRVPLPLDLAQDEPRYVNAKQYSAILKRRVCRAKLEAQTKLTENRKPYRHESRHRHAMNRVRGPGGRFLNVKKLANSYTSAITDSRDNSFSGQSQLTSKVCESELHDLGNCKEGDLNTSFCETTRSNIDNIFHEQDLGCSIYMSHAGGIHNYL